MAKKSQDADPWCVPFRAITTRAIYSEVIKINGPLNSALEGNGV